MLTNTSFFDLAAIEHHDIFRPAGAAWEPLRLLKDYMRDQDYPSLPGFLRPGVPLTSPVVYHEGEFFTADDLAIDYGDATKEGLCVTKDGTLLAGASVIMAGTVIIGTQIKIGKGVKIETGAFIQSPVIIGDNTEVRQGAYLRGYCLVGRRCVVGHVTEVKHSIFLDDAKAGHFAYLGDSIAGHDVNLGAGTKLANLRFMRGDVQIRTPDGPVNTGLRKLGAILGDKAQSGCNAVTNPGTLLGRKSIVLPNTTTPSGFHPENSVIR